MVNNTNIAGGGIIVVAVTTNTGTITATSTTAPLQITGNVTNSSAGVLAAGGGLDRIIDLRTVITGGQIKPQDGTVELRGADIRNVTLTTGIVNLENHSDFSGEILPRPTLRSKTANTYT